MARQVENFAGSIGKVDKGERDVAIVTPEDLEHAARADGRASTAAEAHSSSNLPSL